MTATDDARSSSRPTTGVNVPRELHDRARAAVRLVRRVTGRPYSLAQFTREAFAGQLRIISDTYNSGRPIEPDTTPLETGPNI